MIKKKRDNILMKIITLLGISLLLINFTVTEPCALDSFGEPGSKVNLTDLLQYANNHNPGLLSQQASIKAAHQRTSSAGTLPDPMFTYGSFLTPIETRLGPQERKFSLVQKLPWPQKLGLKRKQARQSENIADLNLEANRQSLFYQIKISYFELAYQREAEQLTSDNILLFEQLTPVVRAAYGSGNVSQAALLQIQMEIEKLKNRFDQLLDLQQAQTAVLNALLGRDIKTPLPKFQKTDTSDQITAAVNNGQFDVTIETLRDLLTLNNPDLQLAEAKIKLTGTTADLAGKSYFPDLSIGVHYIQTGTAVDPTMPDSGQDPLLATISFNLPLWPGNHSALRAETKHLHTAASFAQKDRQNKLSSELDIALAGWRNARRQIVLYNDKLVPLTEQVYEVTAAAFAADQVGYTSLIEAQMSLLTTRLSLHRALADFAVKQAKLELLISSTNL